MKTMAFIFIVGISFGSCTKYSEGPFVSLRTRTERMANNWKIGKAIDNGTDVTSDYDVYTLDLTKKGEATLTASYLFLGVAYDFTTKGTWSFVNNEVEVSFDFDNNDADGIYEIQSLHEDELWLKDNNSSVELHFVPR